LEIYYGINDIERIAKILLQKTNTKTWLFYGDMGVGKTTLIKNLIRLLGNEDEVSSPTFSIVNEYKLNDEKIYHFDLYRIKDTEEAYNFGIEDYLNSNYWTFIEWPEKIESILDTNVDKIILKFDTKTCRTIMINNN